MKTNGAVLRPRCMLLQMTAAGRRPRGNARIKPVNKNALAIVGILIVLLGSAGAVLARPTIDELKARPVLDDYEANVVFGYDIVMDTNKYAGRYTGNALRCASCHLKGGTQPDAIPLNIAGVYPKWRSKNGVRNGIGRRIRDCFLYSLNGIMPPEEAPEVLAVAAYIHYLSDGEIIGSRPKDWGVPTLPDTGDDPNPARGEVVYKRECAICHGENGEGRDPMPPVWGLDSYNAGAGLNNVDKLAGFAWANMPIGKERSLTHQEALDVAAFIHIQHRPFDPREGRLLKLAERLYHRLSLMFGKDKP